MNCISYKAFQIRARPYQLHLTHEWAVELEISRGGHVRLFGTQRHFATEREALDWSYQFGREIIDGKLPLCSVDHLR
jgi:hypothetical protein